MDSKSLFASKTFWTMLLTPLFAWLAARNIAVDPDTQAMIVGAAVALAGIVMRLISAGAVHLIKAKDGGLRPAAAILLALLAGPAAALLAACGGLPIAATGASGAAAGATLAAQLGAAATPAATVANALATADVGVQRASEVATLICANRNLMFATAQTALALAKASDAVHADERKAEGALISLCDNLPSNVATILPAILAVQASLGAAAAMPAAP